MVAPITAPATTPAPIASGVRSRCCGRGACGSGVVVVGAARKAELTVGGAFCALLAGTVAAAEPGTTDGAAAPAGGGAGRAGTPACGAAGGVPAAGAPAGGAPPWRPGAGATAP